MACKAADVALCANIEKENVQGRYFLNCCKAKPLLETCSGKARDRTHGRYEDARVVHVMQDSWSEHVDET